MANRKPQGLEQFMRAQTPAAAAGSGATKRLPRTRSAPAAPRGRADDAEAAPSSEGGPAERVGRPARRATKEGKEQLLVYLHPAGIKQLKLAQVEDDYPSVSAIVAEAVNEWLVKRKRPPVA